MKLPPRRPKSKNPPAAPGLLEFCLILVSAAFITGVILMIVFLARECSAGEPVFSVAVAGAAGLDLDPARDVSSAPATLSPVFNLTFHIDNSGNSEFRACVPDLSVATVSYGDAPLANGSVPAFCAGKKNESEPVAATARGDAVAVPRALRDKLAGELAAGEAAVDVKVTMPGYCVETQCRDAVLTCKAKIGGGQQPPCRLDYVHKEGENNGEEDAPVMFFLPNPVNGMPPFIIWHG